LTQDNEPADFAFLALNRFRGDILPGAMPPLHRYFGNPPLTAIGRVFFPGVFRIENTISPILVKTRHVNRRLLLGETPASQLPALLW